eukprot:CAMPEP_0115671626 /NCGR_PEP_ID=MMETSP0272-20121206/52151_1 /TAXON_ID=71861 /ORGANISM="Scrippsiella trochoidea, Strain CCMP3099" /LENGTH=58 /DNA_ID=CAMNT_0003110407 /DNA_START=96 /DNA_END=268 /DNA_ORIENTATION=-
MVGGSRPLAVGAIAAAAYVSVSAGFAAFAVPTRLVGGAQPATEGSLEITPASQQTSAS